MLPQLFNSKAFKDTQPATVPHKGLTVPESCALNAQRAGRLKGRLGIFMHKIFSATTILWSLLQLKTCRSISFFTKLTKASKQWSTTKDQGAQYCINRSQSIQNTSRKSTSVHSLQDNLAVFVPQWLHSLQDILDVFIPQWLQLLCANANEEYCNHSYLSLNFVLNFVSLIRLMVDLHLHGILFRFQFLMHSILVFCCGHEQTFVVSHIKAADHCCQYLLQQQYQHHQTSIFHSSLNNKWLIVGFLLLLFHSFICRPCFVSADTIATKTNFLQGHG